VSLALATKGIIAGFVGTGTGTGGLYPSDYVASEIALSVDTSDLSVNIDMNEVSISVEMESIELTIETYEED